MPAKFELYQNFPNPFNPTTTIKFGLKESGKVNITIYNILGEKITTLLDKEMDAGIFDVKFNGENLASGIYIYRLSIHSAHSNLRFMKKMLMVK